MRPLERVGSSVGSSAAASVVADHAPFIEVARDLRRGESPPRALSNGVLARWQRDIRGRVLDLAAGERPARRLWSVDRRSARWTTVDLDMGSRPDVVADLTRPLPFGDGVADTVVLSWFLYIAPYPNEVLAEIRRTLKPGGTLILTAPLVYHHDPTPTDFWRFTSEGLGLLLRDAGFGSITIVTLGGRLTAAAYLAGPYLQPERMVAPIVYLLCIAVDRITDGVLRNGVPRCPIGYCVRARAE
jgi:SAM-dependent methyltransferase